MNPETLKLVLSKMLDKNITHADYTLEQLQGGTVGNVQLMSGIARAANEEMPYKIVLKTQKKWARDGDPNSWRREYDLYTSELDKSFSDKLSWPICYHAGINESETETQLWMQYIEGTTSGDMTIEMLETAAAELGRYQARLYIQNPDYLHNIKNLGVVNALEGFYRHWEHKNVEFKYIREPGCEIPKHLCDMIIDIDSRADAIFEDIRKLPVVLCHRDFWIANIIYNNGNIALIDWDTAGWGYLGEDIIQLITDETNPALWEEYKHRLIPAYLNGFAETAHGDSPVRHGDPLVRHCEAKPKQSTQWHELICQIPLVHLGYLCVFHFMQQDLAAGEHYPSIESLQKLHDIFYK